MKAFTLALDCCILLILFPMYILIRITERW